MKSTVRTLFVFSVLASTFGSIDYGVAQQFSVGDFPVDSFTIATPNVPVPPQFVVGPLYQQVEHAGKSLVRGAGKGTTQHTSFGYDQTNSDYPPSNHPPQYVDQQYVDQQYVVDQNYSDDWQHQQELERQWRQQQEQQYKQQLRDWRYQTKHDRQQLQNFHQQESNLQNQQWMQQVQNQGWRWTPQQWGQRMQQIRNTMNRSMNESEQLRRTQWQQFDAIHSSRPWR